MSNSHARLQTWRGGILELPDFGIARGAQNEAIHHTETARVLSGIERFEFAGAATTDQFATFTRSQLSAIGNIVGREKLIPVTDVVEVYNAALNLNHTGNTVILTFPASETVALLKARGFTADHFGAIHPGGKLGALLMRVRDLMRVGEHDPLVAPDLLSLHAQLARSLLQEMDYLAEGRAAVMLQN